MENKGYIYTFMSTILLMIVFSIVFFQIQIYKPKAEDAITKIRLDELHYFMESIKKDFERAVMITGQRATYHLINDIISNNLSYQNYVMTNCTYLNYTGNGSQAAIAELMLCGTINGTNIVDMDDDSLSDWKEIAKSTAEGLNLIFNLEITKIRIMPYDSWSYMVITDYEVSVRDKLNTSFYDDYGLTAMVTIPVTRMHDPLYYIMTNDEDLLHFFNKCTEKEKLNTSDIDEWIELECYRSANSSYGAPSFFDRLDGRVELSEKYLKQSELLANELNMTPRDIGLESLINMSRFSAQIATDPTRSWVDYMYWRNKTGHCWITDSSLTHDDFRIDPEHILKYDMSELGCRIFTYNAPNDVFDPLKITVPINTTIEWYNNDTVNHKISCDEPDFGIDRDIGPGSSTDQLFDETGAFNFMCNEPTHTSPSGDVTVL